MNNDRNDLSHIHQALGQLACEHVRNTAGPAQLMDLMKAVSEGKRRLRFIIDMTGEEMSIAANAHEFETGHELHVLTLAGTMQPQAAPEQEADPRQALSEALISAVLGLAAHALAREPLDKRTPIANELRDGRAALSATINVDCKESQIACQLFRADGLTTSRSKLFEFAIQGDGPTSLN